MSAIATKKIKDSFPRAKIKSVVQNFLPKGANFRLYVVDSKIGKMKIVRVVTPAWKTLQPADRIFRIIQAANANLSPAEQNNILRFSVLTPDEYKDIVGNGSFS